MLLPQISVDTANGGAKVHQLHREATAPRVQGHQIREIEMTNAGTIRVIENSFLGCWEYVFIPSKAWTAENPAAHPECMFTPHDTREEAALAGRDYAAHIGARFIN
jgi:hypothetical protein